MTPTVLFTRLRARQQAFRVALIYVLVAGGWLVCSNELWKRQATDPGESRRFNLLGGLAFVLVMGGLLHLVWRHLLRQWEREIEKHRETETNLRRTERALKTLSTCNGVLVRATSESMLLSQICRAIVETGGYRMVWAGFAENDEAKSVRIAAHAGCDDGYLEQAKISWSDTCERGRGPTGIAIRTGEIVVCNDFQADPKAAPWREEALKRGYSSYIVLPLCVAGEVFGVLAMYAVETDAFNPTEIRLLSELAEDLAYGIQALRTRIKHGQAEAALRQSEDRYRTLFNHSHDAVLLNGAPDHEGRPGKFLSVNNVACRLLGYSREELLELTPLAIIAPEMRPQMPSLLAKLKADGHVVWESVDVAKDGRRIPVEIHSQMIELDGQSMVMSETRDLTEWKQSEAQLRKLSQATEQSPVSIVITDPKGNIEYVNPKFISVTGYTLAEVIGKNPRILKSNSLTIDQLKQYKQLWATILSGKEWHGEFQNTKKNGEKFWESASISPILDRDGRITHFLALKEDITRQKLLEAEFRQAQKMEAIGQLAGGVAHDFNNILSAMLMQADLVEMAENLPAEAAEGIQQIRADIKHAASLTRQLLLFSRRQVMQPRHLDLNEVITNLAKMLPRMIGEDVRLELNLHPTPVVIRADPGMIEQVLMNLAVNARDAMPEGGQLLIETAHKTVDGSMADPDPNAVPGRYVCLSVSDTGGGIPPEVLPRIFEPFFTTKEAGKGTGLGLATVFGIVKHHQGWLKVDNQPGHGVTFHICFPADPATAVEATPAAAIPRPRGGTETILLVEDEAGVRRSIRAILEKHGYKVLESADGIEALDLWLVYQQKIALLLTDLVMPGGLSGQELARHLQAAEPELNVIFMSGYSTETAGQELSLDDSKNFIQKPFAPDQLLETIRRSLDG